MAALRTGIFFSYAGQAWLVLMGFAFVPWYLRMLGAEAFGLVGFMLSLQAISQLLDFGVGSAVNRELSRRAHSGGDATGLRDLVRTFEALVGPAAVASGASIALSSEAIATRWLNTDTLGVEQTQRAVTIMAIAVATLWPANFYGNALSGLERLGTLNVANVIFITLRYA